ncbi:hypothetical protein NDU88_002748 [Pleurodeles waltl]|uniref:Uncharacterized protein n=1 Tax=Pleurodeles waltl TaxID=8319 RepID=A0AAV7VEH0_PLEWA|nr:hypothetical protein NDU88_002748 [Pleurodeles waltl]
MASPPAPHSTQTAVTTPCSIQARRSQNCVASPRGLSGPADLPWGRRRRPLGPPAHRNAGRPSSLRSAHLFCCLPGGTVLTQRPPQAAGPRPHSSAMQPLRCPLFTSVSALSPGLFFARGGLMPGRPHHWPPIQARPNPAAASSLVRPAGSASRPGPSRGTPQTQCAPWTPRCCSPSPAHGPAHHKGSGALPLCFAWVRAAEPRTDASAHFTILTTPGVLFI